MLIIDWMKANVISVTPDTTLLQCRKLFKEHQISRVPVLDTDRVVVGLVSTGDISRFSPQHATPLEIIEFLDVLEETKAKQVMTIAPPTIHYKHTVDQAALLMTEKHLNCLPVVDSDEKLVGILTEWDIFKALVDISGVSHRGIDAAFILENKRGTLRAIMDQLKDDNMRIISVLSSFSDDGMRQVKVRFYSEDSKAEAATLEEFKKHPGLRYWARDGEIVLTEKPAFKD